MGVGCHTLTGSTPVPVRASLPFLTGKPQGPGSVSSQFQVSFNGFLKGLVGGGGGRDDAGEVGLLRLWLEEHRREGSFRKELWDYEVNNWPMWIAQLQAVCLCSKLQMPHLQNGCRDTSFPPSGKEQMQSLQHSAWHLVTVITISFKHHTSPTKKALLSPYYWWRNGSTGRLSDFPRSHH